ncbi:MAG: hypothetical protein AB7T32_07585, partial [Dehalococcoidia bacterium]
MPPTTSVVEPTAPALFVDPPAVIAEAPVAETPPASVFAVASVPGPVVLPPVVTEVLGVVLPAQSVPFVAAIAEAVPEPAVEPQPQPAPQVATVASTPLTPAAPPAFIPPETKRIIENVFDQVPGLGDLSTNLGVIGINLLLAIIALICLLLATTIFNATLKENAGSLSIDSRIRSAWTVLHLGGVSIDDLPAPIARAITLLQPVVLLSLTAVVYGALDPNFGWNETSLVLFIGLIAGITLTTFLFEGGQVLVSSRRFKTDAHLRLFPTAILIAALSVLLTRLTSFHPGVIFGFVGSAVISASGVNRRQEGLIVWLPLFGLFCVSLVALALVTPLREWSAGRDDIWSTIPETIAVAVFVGGGQSVLLSLLPVTFNDGHKVWNWSRIAWFALAL